MSVGAPSALLQLGRVFNGKSNSQGATINNKAHHLRAQQGLADWRSEGRVGACLLSLLGSWDADQHPDSTKLSITSL